MQDNVLQKVTEPEIDELSRLAFDVWTEHYKNILDMGQITYMLNKFQSSQAIREQQQYDRYEYYWIVDHGTKAGYCAVQPMEDSLFLSKLYLQKEYRGKGLARRTLQELEDRCRKDGFPKIWLTVNRNNPSVNVYDSLHFTKAREQVADIGNGYVMDDYIMKYFIKK